jgi:hypothetical protein
MVWFEDDSHQIPEEILNMSREERKKKIAEYEEQLRNERDILRQARRIQA